MAKLADRYQLFAVDLRRQGRSSRTPGRYTLDTIGNDLVRFLASVVRRPPGCSPTTSGW